MPLSLCLAVDNYAHAQTVDTRPFFLGRFGPGNEASRTSANVAVPVVMFSLFVGTQCVCTCLHTYSHMHIHTCTCVCTNSHSLARTHTHADNKP